MAMPMKIEIYADGANVDEMVAAYRAGAVKGFTTNPTLMRKAGISDYESFAHSVLAQIKDLPISFEVFSDEFAEMERQAHKLANLGENVFVKIPITNTRAESSVPLIERLIQARIKLNITAILTVEQVRAVCQVLDVSVPAIVSVFGGRVADTGCDPVPLMRECLSLLKPFPQAKLLWASPREVLNVVQANEIGCHIITITQDILKKVPMLGKDLTELSLETVQMFYRDAQCAGYVL